MLQPHLHSPRNAWLQCVAQRPMQTETRNIWVLEFGVPYIRDFTVNTIIFVYKNASEYVTCNMTAILLKHQCVKKIHSSFHLVYQSSDVNMSYVELWPISPSIRTSITLSPHYWAHYLRLLVSNGSTGTVNYHKHVTKTQHLIWH